MNPRSCILALTLLVSGSLLTPVFAAKAKIVAAKGVNMANYKTYQWLPPRILVKTGIDENYPAAPILKSVVGKHLELVGLKEVAEGADLQIQAYVTNEYIPQLEAVMMGEGTNSTTERLLPPWAATIARARCTSI